jgi:hypothetical protein
MQRVDGNYLYQVGSQIHPLSELRYHGSVSGPATTMEEARFPVFVAEGAIDGLVNRSVFRLKTSVQSGQNLLEGVRKLRTKIDQTPVGQRLLNFSMYIRLQRH